MKIPKAIFFDVGNTLLKEISYDLDKGIAKSLKELKVECKDECFINPNYLKQKIEDFYSDSHKEFILIDWLKEFLADTKINVTLEQLERIIWNNTVVLKPYQHIPLVLDRLKQKGISLSIISNTVFTGNAMKYELSKHGLLNYFEYVFTSADLGIRKPSKQIFLKAIDSIKLPPSDIWFVGDNWEADIMGANSVGLKAIWKRQSSIDKAQNSERPYFHDWQNFLREFIED